ncbi:hypothetical protein RN001_006876 [Aquatica leii]|uniref:Uncharacterized protein n=1 Tax=Aquatica leii TaxID=1421715 RepID=A0AAN7PE28_9COLE|nr:hypothetical protein RN001_006876 [Aquatica leii]
MTSKELSFTTHVMLRSEGKADASNVIRNLSKSPNRAKNIEKHSLKHLDDEEIETITLMYKWGCDGSQQTTFKQKFINNSDSDANLFQSSFVPLQLSCGHEKQLIWQNPLPSSPRYCRPIRIRFVKETADITKEEISYIENKINLLEPTQKQIVQQKKKEIQEEFRTKLGLIVDVLKAGFGNSNDGNTSRRFFADHELSASITGIDSGLIYSIEVILEAVSSGHKIDTTKFKLFCSDSAKLCVELYPWHPMTPTLYKILFHGSFIIEKALLPIGMMSEEAAEARNKHFRLYRQNYARKFSRESCNLDIINRLLLSSDSLITGMRPTQRKTTKPFLKETIEMLLPAETPNQSDSSDDQDLGEETVEFSDEPWMSLSE